MLKRWLVAMAALAGIAATLALGFWQLDRARQRTALHEAIVAREAQAPLTTQEIARGVVPADLHRRVILAGRWAPERTVFLDNRQMQAKQGFYVVTPLLLEGSGKAILVQRGWAPRNFGQREQLPPVGTPAGRIEVQGRLAPPPAKLYEFDAAETGAIRQNLDLARFRAETRLDLLELSVQQAGAASEGLLRQWPEPSSGAEKNRGYAFQWFALAALIAVLYAWFQFVAPRRRRPAA